ncbi:NAD(P)-dependent dehydrogenase (short-subunit alcohol dehydrogenase family) [Thermocatellispora tengchongensis]|uniref:NAD(P)-dependent dehydrogenase (Short-subunit alcohol dehydrogenase family) n=1 Tax=Thermocatellispora tengchongensis TaxID=1073253 RepID=A0A840NYI0_9ACTN|nr:SDR family oxidoreductase [Thermocatellispora tengchongensis]MBB5131266.1 NAD(P)-dependent dehydrogenase (short-subunit alcohol dehydrogenase family) [Thermocatellispora tengchongensis]
MIALITGANKGIGHEIARLLGERGVTPIVGARDEKRGREAADRLGAPYVRLDVTDAASVAAAAKQIEEEHGRLDILVNNAGIIVHGEDSRPSATPLEAVRRTYEVNVFGVITVTNAMLPLLRRAPAARIVNMSSELGSLTLTTNPDTPWYDYVELGYNSSKAALNMVTVSYAKELRDTPIKVNAANPGYCATDLNAHQGFRTAEQGAAIAVELALLGDDGPSGAFLQDEGPLPW